MTNKTSMYKLTKTYPNKRAFITGAGSGLGRELCKLLAADGWTIGICDINEKSLNETVEMITQAGGKAIPFILDVADKNRYKEVAEEVLKQTGGIDLVVNNAGVGDGGLFEEYSLENWEWITGVNQMSVIFGCHYFVPVMKKQAYGQIINISSIASVSVSPSMSAYNTTKAAVKALSETLYAELKESGIRVSVVMPFFFRTNIIQYARGDSENRETAVHMVSGARDSAADIAHRILKAAGAGKFHILVPREAKILFHLRRFFPMTMLKLNAIMSKHKDKVRENARKNYEKRMQQLKK